MKSQALKKHKKLERNISQKFFTTCKLNDNRKSFNKLWSTVKDETLPLVEERGGFVIGHFNNFDYSLEIIKKATTRFDIKAFKDKHPELYESFLIGGESVELKTKYKRSK